jgi:hypothetical protein
VPGATEKFRSFFEKYTPDPGLKERRSKMYGLRSKILHGSDLVQLDQGLGRAIGWDPPWWSERENEHRTLGSDEDCGPELAERPHLTKVAVTIRLHERGAGD